jgi:hypothetical protein
MAAESHTFPFEHFRSGRAYGAMRDRFLQAGLGGIDAYFRRIEFYDEEYDRVLVFLTSQMGLAGSQRVNYAAFS